MSAIDVSNITAEALSKLAGLTPDVPTVKTSAAAPASQRTAPTPEFDIQDLLAQAAARGAEQAIAKLSHASQAEAAFEKRSSDIRNGVLGIVERACKVSTLKTLAEVGALNPENPEEAAIIERIPALERASQEEQEELAGAVVAGDQADDALQSGMLEAAATDPELAAEYAGTLGDEVTPEDVDAIADLIIEEAAAQEGGLPPEEMAMDEKTSAARVAAFEKRAAFRAGVFDKVSEMNEQTQRLLLRRADYRLAEAHAYAAAAAE